MSFQGKSNVRLSCKENPVRSQFGNLGHPSSVWEKKSPEFFFMSAAACMPNRLNIKTYIHSSACNGERGTLRSPCWGTGTQIHQSSSSSSSSSSSVPSMPSKSSNCKLNRKFSIPPTSSCKKVQSTFMLILHLPGKKKNTNGSWLSRKQQSLYSHFHRLKFA